MNSQFFIVLNIFNVFLITLLSILIMISLVINFQQHSFAVKINPITNFKYPSLQNCVLNKFRKHLERTLPNARQVEGGGLRVRCLEQVLYKTGFCVKFRHRLWRLITFFRMLCFQQIWCRFKASEQGYSSLPVLLKTE